LLLKKEFVGLRSRILAFRGAGGEPPRRYHSCGVSPARCSHRSLAPSAPTIPLLKFALTKSFKKSLYKSKNGLMFRELLKKLEHGLKKSSIIVSLLFFPKTYCLPLAMTLK